MGIVTLISDMGDRDHYVAAVKAAIYAHAPQAIIVDISHRVRTFDIEQGAYLLSRVWSDFPIGTVHLIGLMPEFGAETPHVVVVHMGHYFIGADNGIFSLLFSEEPEAIFELAINRQDAWNFPMKGNLALAAAHLSRGGVPEFLGKRTDKMNHLFIREAQLDDLNEIRGSVIHIDHYGNVITNITRSLFESARRGRSYSIFFKKAGYAITRIASTFHDVAEGERLALWTTEGNLMIAIRGGSNEVGGSAASLFGFSREDVIRIEFNGDPFGENDFQE